MRAFATLLVLLLAACAPKNTSKTPSPAPFSTLKWTDLAGPAFTLSALSVKGQAVALPAARRPAIQFGAQGRVSGTGGVNRFSAEAVLDGGTGLTWAGPAAVTKMAGPPEAMALEDAFLDALQSVTRIELAGGVLKLASADGSARLEFTR